MITETIIAEAKFFSIISDEVQDAASIEQITFLLRYVHKKEDSYVVKENLRSNIVK